MKKLFSSIVFLIQILSVFSCSGQSNTPLTEDALKSLADEYLKINPEASGVMAAVDYPEKINWSYSTGFVGNEKKKALTGDELFIAASITKTFVAVCILQMEEEGLLSTNDKVISYIDASIIKQLTEYRGNSYENDLTIEHLLRHTSGVFDYLNEGQVHLEAYKKRPKTNYSLQDRVAIALEKGTSPNKLGKYHYSNTNYILLGMIAEKIDANTISDVLEERIIKPLGLKNTTLQPTDVYVPKMFKGYYTDWDLTSFTLNFNWMNPAGGLLTNINDLLIFAKATFKGSLFKKPSTLKKMLDFKKGYGLGVMQYEKSRKFGSVHGHSGFDPGYTCYLAYIEKLDATIVTVINQSELKVVMPAFLVVKTVHLIKEHK